MSCAPSVKKGEPFTDIDPLSKLLPDGAPNIRPHYQIFLPL